MYNRSVRAMRGLSKQPMGRNVLLLTILCAVFFAATVILGIMFQRANQKYQSAVSQVVRLAGNAAAEAQEQANRLTASIQADTAVRLGEVKMNIHLVDKLNGIYQQLTGKTLASSDMLQLVQGDIRNFEVIVQSGTTSTLEIRSLLGDRIIRLRETMQ